MPFGRMAHQVQGRPPRACRDELDPLRTRAQSHVCNPVESPCEHNGLRQPRRSKRHRVGLNVALKPICRLWQQGPTRSVTWRSHRWVSPLGRNKPERKALPGQARTFRPCRKGALNPPTAQFPLTRLASQGDSKLDLACNRTEEDSGHVLLRSNVIKPELLPTRFCWNCGIHVSQLSAGSLSPHLWSQSPNREGVRGRRVQRPIDSGSDPASADVVAHSSPLSVWILRAHHEETQSCRCTTSPWQSQTSGSQSC